nr:hypothetical protein [Delftia acidovorans]
MAEKYDKAALYSKDVTIACEIALGLLFEAFGSFKESLRLIGGLVLRYLAPAEPAHVGTTDVDIVLDVQVLLAGDDYSSLREQLKKAGFQRLVKDGKASSWQWRLVVHGIPVVVEFLVNSDNPNEKGLVPLDGEEISACRIPHAGMVKDWFMTHTLRFERPDGAGISTEAIRHADAAAFVALKALAMKYRHEPKDVADLVHVLRNYEGAPASIAEQYAARLTAGSMPSRFSWRSRRWKRSSAPTHIRLATSRTGLGATCNSMKSLAQKRARWSCARSADFSLNSFNWCVHGLGADSKPASTHFLHNPSP